MLPCGGGSVPLNTCGVNVVVLSCSGGSAGLSCRWRAGEDGCSGG